MSPLYNIQSNIPLGGSWPLLLSIMDDRSFHIFPALFSSYTLFRATSRNDFLSCYPCPILGICRETCLMDFLSSENLFPESGNRLVFFSVVHFLGV